MIKILYSKLFSSAAMQGPLQFLVEHANTLFFIGIFKFVLTVKMNVKVLNKMFDLGAIYGTCKLKIVLSSSGFIN